MSSCGCPKQVCLSRVTGIASHNRSRKTERFPYFLQEQGQNRQEQHTQSRKWLHISFRPALTGVSSAALCRHQQGCCGELRPALHRVPRCYHQEVKQDCLVISILQLHTHGHGLTTAAHVIFQCMHAPSVHDAQPCIKWIHQHSSKRLSWSGGRQILLQRPLRQA